MLYRARELEPQLAYFYGSLSRAAIHSILHLNKFSHLLILPCLDLPMLFSSLLQCVIFYRGLWVSWVGFIALLSLQWAILLTCICCMDILMLCSLFFEVHHLLSMIYRAFGLLHIHSWRILNITKEWSVQCRKLSQIRGFWAWIEQLLSTGIIFLLLQSCGCHAYWLNSSARRCGTYRRRFWVLVSVCSMDIDLSKELMQPSKLTLERQVAAARRASELDLAAKVPHLKFRVPYILKSKFHQHWHFGTFIDCSSFFGL